MNYKLFGKRWNSANFVNDLREHHVQIQTGEASLQGAIAMAKAFGTEIAPADLEEIGKSSKSRTDGRESQRG